MNRLIYFQLEIKRKIKLLPHIILGTIVLSLVAGAIVFCAGKMLNAKNKVSEKRQLVFSSQDDSELTKLVVSILSKSPSLTNVCNVIETDYTEALELAQQENTIASVIIPEDFMESLLNGTNDSIDIYFSSTRSIFTLIITELTKAAQTTLQAAQAGVYTLHDYYVLQDAAEYEDAANEELNLIYLTKAFSRDKFFHRHKLTATGNLSIQNYYFASALMLVLLLLGCVFILKAKDTDRLILMKLKQNGIGFVSQMFAHVISIFLVLYPIFVLGNAGMFILCKYTDIALTIRPAHIFTDGFVITLCCSAIICFISNIFMNKYSAILLHFIFVMASSFVTGAFIPSVFLPDSLRSLARCLPTTYLFKTIGNVLSGEVIIDNILKLIYSTIISFILGVLLLTLRYRNTLCFGRKEKQ